MPQTTTGGTSGTSSAGSLGLSDFTLQLKRYDSGQKDWIQMNDTEKKFFFSRARCECNGDQTNNTGYFKILIRPGTNTVSKISSALALNGTTGTGRLYAGGNAINCLSPSSVVGGNLSASCLNLLDPTTYNAEFSMNVFITRGYFESPAIPVAWLFGSVLAPVCDAPGSPRSCDEIESCARDLVTQRIYFWAQTTTTSTPDAADISWEVKLNGQITDAPSSVTAEGGNEALTVRWVWPEGQAPSAQSNFKGVQVFCQRGADYQVFPAGSFSRSYDTAAILCPGVAPTTTTTDASPFSNFSPDYLCSGLLPSTTTGYRITGLQNGIPYGVAVVSVDNFGNIGPITAVTYGTPVPTVDFYTQYKNDGGAAQGGFCAMAGRSGHGLAVTTLALVGLALILTRRRGSRRRRAGPGALALLVSAGTLTAFSGQARAQAIYHDDAFDDAGADSQPWQGSPRQYAIEIRFGLYTPDVDSEFSDGGQKPNAFIFGTQRRPMWQLEYDWQFLQAFGTLALGASIGYYKENAAACLLSDLRATGQCTRTGDNTSLRLIPLAALVIYRFDEAAIHWKIPVVPYGKIGLNYTFWTVNDGNGNVPDYPGGGRGQGGTAGWQAAVGISLQLDFLDPSAARGFDADVGVNHSYAFFELAHIDASGLYRKDALRVGDNTWFAGLMFEF